jgi:hypothetical protein
MPKSKKFPEKPWWGAILVRWSKKGNRRELRALAGGLKAKRSFELFLDKII